MEGCLVWHIWYHLEIPQKCIPRKLVIYVWSACIRMPVAGESHKGLQNFVLKGREKRSEEHTSELQSPMYIVCRLLLEKKKTRLYSPVASLWRRPSSFNFSK